MKSFPTLRSLLHSALIHPRTDRLRSNDRVRQATNDIRRNIDEWVRITSNYKSAWSEGEEGWGCGGEEIRVGFRLQALLESSYSSYFFMIWKETPWDSAATFRLLHIIVFAAKYNVSWCIMIHDCFVAQAWIHNDKYFTIDEFICFSLYHDRCFGCTRPYSSVVADDTRMAWEDWRR